MATIATEIVSNGVSNITAPLTPQEKRHLGALEKRIERGLYVFREVGEALMDIRDNRLYRESHATFDAYCRERWQFDRNRAYQLIGAAEVVRAIPDEFQKPINEAQARELVPLVHENPQAVAEVWKQVMADDSPLSAARIRTVVQTHMAPKDPEPQVSPTTSLVASITRVTAQAKAWMESKPGRAERNLVREAVTRLNEAVS